MTREEIIRNLKYTMEKHKNDTVNTFGTNISVMCKDILDYLDQEPCEDCISRQAAIDMLKYLHGEMPEEEFVNALPPVTPTRKTGRWIRKLIRNDKGGCVGAKMICTCCGKDNECDKRFNYCPNCGAEMEGEEESE